MATLLEILEYKLPAYLACYLINGNTDNLTDNEILDINSFLDKHRIHILSVSEETEFRHTNDLNTMGCECCTYFATPF
jgi:hypothetical protein